ncbi:hypothetical protein CpsigB_04660 [Corynebacterium pseudotuberculosis]|uniref:Uncharacterized protein n=2 Tax=Corynebacterium pseudotuberculosis TaxID=1719 RepID=A0A6D2LG64_CORP2|nr:hypothetical protein CPFRC_08495 [Corynebacterium pseudotuberculosis FRC41]AEK49209.1 hypothetical protein CP1002_04650 [Corynebacterium pseudotuberculosis 1002]AEK93013.1 Hypothetical protein CpPAT10_1687b [Corynebacterium pseudotuberculosis PAT10]AER24519.1 hypothetical protein CPI19_03020 [Corynebacterium pseudotuberculosis I19]AFF22839.1 Hypothetical protein CpP54B96_1716 [Corynebacterium pseudotuberculosis P54B96]AFH52638.1 Hypothetical protein Cp267_1755 [Corynebacterium pseudotubercu
MPSRCFTMQNFPAGEGNRITDLILPGNKDADVCVLRDFCLVDLAKADVYRWWVQAMWII